MLERFKSKFVSGNAGTDEEWVHGRNIKAEEISNRIKQRLSETEVPENLKRIYPEESPKLLKVLSASFGKDTTEQIVSRRASRNE